MGRLQVAADAIAEMKKAIPKQGNQVVALQSSRMNSQSRKMAMRDEGGKAFEYTNDDDHVWNNEDAVAEGHKYDYKTNPATAGAGATTGPAPDTE